jgi:Flp pilus assembly pilin Flp
VSAPLSALRGDREMKSIKNFLRDETGMETLEYALIAGLIAVVALLVYGSGWGTTLKDKLTAASSGTTG